MSATQPIDSETRRRRLAAALRFRLRNPPAHWRVLGVCLIMVFALIAFQGFCTHTIGTTSEPHENPASSAPLKGSEPLLGARGHGLYSPEQPPGRRIALTFDDGPDPRWTPQILRVLHSFGVTGTFFMVGSQAARHPDVVRLVDHQGSEIANHTFTHTALSSGPTWQRRVQIQFTEAVLVGITGRYPRFIRPPYSATTDAVTPHDDRSLADLAGHRYLIALADYDSLDWGRPGVRQIVANAMPRHGRGGIIMFHDGGGNRSQTVAALGVLIPRLQAAGYRFVPIRDLMGMSADQAEPRAGGWQHARSIVFLWAVRLAFWMTGFLGLLIVGAGVLVAVRLLVVLPTAWVHVRRTRRGPPAAAYRPTVAVIVPAFNEEVGIAKAVVSLAGSTYPDLEIVVVDDGSTDATASIVEGLALPQVRLVRRANGGKAAALTAGILHTDADIVVMVDGDTVFEADTITRLVQPLADPEVAAVSGNTKVGNRSSILGRWQHIEYVIGFNLDRRMYQVFRSTPTVPGAIGAFRRSVIEVVGGVPGDTLAEDTDLALAIGRLGHRVVYAEDALAWTEAPSNLSGLWRQRYRWSFGTMQAIWKHKGALVSRDPRDRRIGRRALPYMVLFQYLLPMIAPLIDIYALYSLVFTDAILAIGAWLAFNAAQLVIGVVAFRLDREPLQPLLALPLQQFVYRQLMYLVVIESAISALVGARASWKNIPRTGDVELRPHVATRS